MDAKSKRRRARRAFTLVEMLTVIVIIGILASLITAAVIAARNRAKIAAIKMEISDLEQNIISYENKYGPMPDFTDQDAVLVHLKIRFPKWRPGQGASPNFSGQSPASAIVFFLGGMADGNGGVMGFNSNPKNPFASGGSRTTPLFDFDQRRLREDDNGALVYVPDTGDETAVAPYVYFRSDERRNGYENMQCSVSGGTVRPYRNVETDKWANPQKFQIISAGLDGLFGNGVAYPLGEDYDVENFDNITNFVDGKLEDAIP